MKVLLLNPPIYDFSAYDVWIKPLGLLYLSNILKEYGCEVVFLDCMDRFFQVTGQIKSKEDGTGKFHSEVVEKPEILRNIPLNYRRYGLERERIKSFLEANSDSDFVLITSVMTYWYLGVCEILELVTETIPKAKILLGGNYPILMPQHSERLFGEKVDFISHSYDLSEVLDFIFPGNHMNKKYSSFKNYPVPDYSHYSCVPYVVLRTSYGCFHNCDYCSVGNTSRYTSKSPEVVADEISQLYHRYNVKNFVFYDDALFSSTVSAKDLLRKIKDLRLAVNFFTPNGINPKYIDKELGELMKEINFVDPRLSLESISDETHRSMDRKIELRGFEKGLNNLILAGYKSHEISTYIIAGLSMERPQDLENSLFKISKYKVRIRLCEFSPIPKSNSFSQLGFDENIDPLFHNNSIFIFNGVPGRIEPWCSYNEFKKLKECVKKLNTDIKSSDFVDSHKNLNELELH